MKLTLTLIILLATTTLHAQTQLRVRDTYSYIVSNDTLVELANNYQFIPTYNGPAVGAVADSFAVNNRVYYVETGRRVYTYGAQPAAINRNVRAAVLKSTATPLYLSADGKTILLSPPAPSAAALQVIGMASAESNERHAIQTAGGAIYVCDRNLNVLQKHTTTPVEDVDIDNDGNVYVLGYGNMFRLNHETTQLQKGVTALDVHRNKIYYLKNGTVYDAENKPVFYSNSNAGK